MTDKLIKKTETLNLEDHMNKLENEIQKKNN